MSIEQRTSMYVMAGTSRLCARSLQSSAVGSAIRKYSEIVWLLMGAVQMIPVVGAVPRSEQDRDCLASRQVNCAFFGQPDQGVAAR